MGESGEMTTGVVAGVIEGRERSAVRSEGSEGEGERKVRSSWGGGGCSVIEIELDWAGWD